MTYKHLLPTDWIKDMNGFYINNGLFSEQI
jgi:hypothetical protein